MKTRHFNDHKNICASRLGFFTSIVFMLLICVGCSTPATHKTLTYEYYVPPMAQIKGEHKTIAIKLEGKNFKQPDHYPESDRLRLTWIDDYEQADVQVRIHIKPSVLKHNHNYYHKTTEFNDLRPIREINQARLKAHVQTNYEVEIRDRKKNEQLLFFLGGRQFYFESLEDLSSLQGSEKTVVKDFKQNEPYARQAVVDYLWDNMKGDRYCLLKHHKVKVMAEEFELLTYHPDIKEFRQAWKTLSDPNKKLTAPLAKQYYNQALSKLENQYDQTARELIDEANAGLAAAEYILLNQYDPKITNSKLLKQQNR